MELLLSLSKNIRKLKIQYLYLHTLKKYIMKNTQIKKLFVITRGDITSGLQIAQAGHSISQFHLDHPDLAKTWNNNYLISLSTSMQGLETILNKLCENEIPVSYFTEPDIGDELTSICFLGTKETNKITSSLPLSLSKP